MANINLARVVSTLFLLNDEFHISISGYFSLSLFLWWTGDYQCLWQSFLTAAFITSVMSLFRIVLVGTSIVYQQHQYALRPNTGWHVFLLQTHCAKCQSISFVNTILFYKACIDNFTILL